MAKHTELTLTQIEYLSKCFRNSIKYADINTKCRFAHEWGNMWSVYISKIESNRFYLHNLTPKYIVLDNMDVNKDNIQYQFELTNKFFKEIK